MVPITLFGKSFIEMLNADEAPFSMLCSIPTSARSTTWKCWRIWLWKSRGQRSCEKVVGDVARKTPVLHSVPNVLHSSLCLNELSGHAIEMRGVPALAGGKPTRHKGGVVIIYN